MNCPDCFACNQGRDCPVRLHQRNGGESVDTDPPFTPEQAGRWTAWLLYFLAAVTCLCAGIAVARFVEALS